MIDDRTSEVLAATTSRPAVAGRKPRGRARGRPRRQDTEGVPDRSHSHEAWDDDSTAAAGTVEVLAEWVPMPTGATAIHLLQRTTGDERIVTMHADIADVGG